MRVRSVFPPVHVGLRAPDPHHGLCASLCSLQRLRLLLEGGVPFGAPSQHKPSSGVHPQSYAHVRRLAQLCLPHYCVVRHGQLWCRTSVDAPRRLGLLVVGAPMYYYFGRLLKKRKTPGKRVCLRAAVLVVIVGSHSRIIQLSLTKHIGNVYNSSGRVHSYP